MLHRHIPPYTYPFTLNFVNPRPNESRVQPESEYDKLFKEYIETRETLRSEFDKKRQMTKTFYSGLTANQTDNLNAFLNQVAKSANVIIGLRWHAIGYRNGNSEAVTDDTKVTYISVCMKALKNHLNLIRYYNPEELASSSVEQLDHYTQLLIQLENDNKAAINTLPLSAIECRAIERNNAGTKIATAGIILAMAPATIALLWVVASLALVFQPPALAFLVVVTVAGCVGIGGEVYGFKMCRGADLTFFSSSNPVNTPVKRLEDSRRELGKEGMREAISAANRPRPGS